MQQQTSNDILDQLLRESAQYGDFERKISQHDIPLVIVENDHTNDTDSFINNLGNSLGLTIPQVRTRSNSIASSHHSFIDDCFSDMGSDYGAMSPFPGATVVQIPSPWIREINSPSQLSLNEPMASLSPNSPYIDNNLNSPHSPYNDNPNFGGSLPQIDIQHLDFLDFYNQQYGENASSPSFNLQSSESMPHLTVPSANLPAQKPAVAKTSSGATLPSGKFWNTVKQNDQTLYQCPWPNCSKSTFV